MPLNIQKKILGVFLLVSFLIITIYTVISLQSYKAGVQQELDLRSRKALTIIQNQFRTYKDTAMTRVNEIGHNDSLQRVFLGGNREELVSYLHKLSARANMDFFEVLDLAGVVRVRLHDLENYGDKDEADYAVQALKGYTFTTATSIDEQPYLLAATNLQGLRGEKIGIIVGGYHISHWLMDEIKRNTGFDIVIYRNDQSVASSQIGVDYHRYINQSLDPQVRSALGDDERRGAQSYLDEKIVIQEKYKVIYAPIRDEQEKEVGIVMVGFNMEYVDQDIRDYLITIMIIALFIMFPTGFVSFILARGITASLSTLTETLLKVEQGDLNQRAAIHTSDEVGALARTFNLMIEKINAGIEHERDAHERQTELLQRLQELDKLKDEFLANTSHELRTPLNGIIGLAESLIDGVAGPLNAEQKNNMVMLHQSGRRLSNMVNDILDFSKLKYNNIDLSLGPVPLREITKLVMTLNRPFIGARKSALLYLIPPELPPALADETRLIRILHNLIGNAIKFTEEGEVRVTARLLGETGTDAAGGQLAITVADTGIGIADDQQKRIFRSFEQEDSSTARQYGGTGLGLSITKQLVELHGGTITLESQKDTGSSFTFTLPASQEKLEITADETSDMDDPEMSKFFAAPKLNEDEQTELALSNISSPVNGGTEQLTVLVVDDEPVNLQVMDNHLRGMNFNVLKATNGMEALKIVEDGVKPDLILLDVMMPQMTGYELCRKLRETYTMNELPIIMLSAKNQVTDLVEGLDAGANDYLAKPFSKLELLTRIKTHVELLKTNLAFARFVPLTFLKFLNKKVTELKLGDQVQKEMTILFSDIRSFTTLSESLTPKETFDFINGYLSQMGPIIRNCNGFIDKYIGDAIMALFPEKPEDALLAAIDMQSQIMDFNAFRNRQSLSSIRIGIGIHMGSLMLGTVGESERMEGTVLSDAVNLTSRLEELSKHYKASILISSYTIFKFAKTTKYMYRFLGRMLLKGKNIPVPVLEVFEGDPPHIMELKHKTLSDFEEAIHHYFNREFVVSKQKFGHILSLNPEDGAARMYHQNCELNLLQGVPDDWDGVLSMGHLK